MSLHDKRFGLSGGGEVRRPPRDARCDIRGFILFSFFIIARLSAWAAGRHSFLLKGLPMASHCLAFSSPKFI